jgi:hypothetical protein
MDVLWYKIDLLAYTNFLNSLIFNTFKVKRKFCFSKFPSSNRVYPKKNKKRT